MIGIVAELQPTGVSTEIKHRGSVLICRSVMASENTVPSSKLQNLIHEAFESEKVNTPKFLLSKIASLKKRALRHLRKLIYSAKLLLMTPG